MFCNPARGRGIKGETAMRLLSRLESAFTRRPRDPASGRRLPLRACPANPEPPL
jgi:hypothetical protein